MAAGIYTIRHAHSGRVYLGHAVDVAARWRLHRFHLRHGTHHSRRLQEDWDRDGAGAFRLEVVEAGGTRAREAALIRCVQPAYNEHGAAAVAHARHAARAARAVSRAVRTRTQKGAHSMTTSGSDRVALNARVDPALREQARQTADARGIGLNDLIIASVTAYCQEAPAPSAAEVPAPALGMASSDQAYELLRLAELMAADMHLVREVLHALHPSLEVEARTRTRSWISRLGIGAGR